MKPLPTEFIGKGEVYGFIFKQLKASDKGYMYEVRIPNTDAVYYEVFKYMTARPHPKSKNLETERHVFYPQSKHFGTNAWCFGNKLKADEKFNDLTNPQPSKDTRSQSS